MYVLTLIWLDLVKIAKKSSFCSLSYQLLGPNYLKMLRLESSGDFEHLTTLVCLDIMRNLDSYPQRAKTN